MSQSEATRAQGVPMEHEAGDDRPIHARAAGTRSLTARAQRARAVPVPSLLAGGAILGVLGDVLMRPAGPPGLNMFLWLASVAVAAVVLQRRAGGVLDGERLAWLVAGAWFAAGLMWRDSPLLRLLALGCTTLAFALAAYRPGAAWVRHAGVLRYARAWATGALHAWTATVPVLLDATRSIPRSDSGRVRGWGHASGVVRGLVIALPLLFVFGTLFMSADAVFEGLVLDVLRFDFDVVASHVVLFGVFAWIATGYLRGFLIGTELTSLRVAEDDSLLGILPRRPTLSITEIATVLAALDLLFLSFVVVQFRYLFGGDALVQVTPDLTYAEYARRGFFELVFATFLVVPILLSADWLLERRTQRAEIVFRGLAGLQVGLVLAITASALQRVRLYWASYGLTDARFYALVLLLWIGVMLLWLAATVLRGRRDWFAFGALASGLTTVALMFALNPDAFVARTNVERVTTAGATARFDVSYIRSLSGDAVPVLVEALPSLPRDVQCPLARHILDRWPPEAQPSLRTWNWAASRAREDVRRNEAQLRSFAGTGPDCPGESTG